MSLASELSQYYDEFHRTAPPEVSATVKKTTAGFIATFDPSKAIQVGDHLPPFKLSDATGKQVTSESLLSKGPVLISFYRGEWCPFCSLELRALQKHLPEFQAKGVTLVAISPELPDTSLSTVEKHKLEFLVLSDVGNKLARQLGITIAQPDDMGDLLYKSGVQWEKRYGTESLEIPVPATLLVGMDGVVKNTFVDANNAVRLEPETALEWIAKL